jgi:hypothetical protein
MTIPEPEGTPMIPADMPALIARSMVDVQAAEAAGHCLYSAAHAMREVPATTVITCGPLGPVPCCEACAGFYARQGGTR